MSSKHDIMTTVIAVSILAVFTVLTLTHNTTTQIETILGGAFSSVVAYFFTRGGAAIGQGSTQPVSQTVSQDVVTAMVSTALSDLSKQPAQGDGSAVTTNQGGTQN